MNCICDNPPSVYWRETRQARKRHRCDECGYGIRPGEQYEHVRGVWDGSAATYRTCCRCLDLRDFVEDKADCECWEHGNILENAVDIVADDYMRTPGLWFGFCRRLIAVRMGNERHA